MVVQFCDGCGNLLDESADETIQYELCGRTNILISSHGITAHDMKRDPKSESGPIIDVECDRCPSKQATYAQVQLRSADEGSTIIYTCLGCGYKWQENN